METSLKQFEVESETGEIRSLWDWSVSTSDGRFLSGIETSLFAAKFYILIATFRFTFTRAGE